MPTLASSFCVKVEMVLKGQKATKVLRACQDPLDRRGRKEKRGNEESGDIFPKRRQREMRKVKKARKVKKDQKRPPARDLLVEGPLYISGGAEGTVHGAEEHHWFIVVSVSFNLLRIQYSDWD